METQQQHIRSWDDLIFENRNQTYGAYAMRQGYANGLFKSVIAAASLLGVIMLSGNSPTERGLPPVEPKDSIVLMPEVFDIKPDIEPPAPKGVTPPAPPQPADLAVRVVLHDPVTPDSLLTPAPTDVTLTAPKSGDGIPGGTGTEPSTGSSNGLGTDSGIDTNREYTHVQVMPSYPGGYEGMMKFLKKKLRYPRAAEMNRIEGTSYVQFVIDPQGNVTNVKVLTGFHALCDKEAARVIGLVEKWNPGIQNDRNVSVRMVMPIRFKLSD